MLFSALSALLLIAAFPNFNLNFLAFAGLVPLFSALQGKTPKKAFLISYLCGFLFYLGALYWIFYVTFFGLIALCSYLALYFGVFGLFFSLLCKVPAGSQRTKRGFLGLLLIPAIWTFLEYIQSRLFTGFGWALLGYSQYRNLLFAQIADFSGVYGVSFAIVTINTVLWILIRNIIGLRGQKGLLSAFGPLLALVLIFASVYGYGLFRLNEEESKSISVKISVIQGNIPQHLKWDPDESEAILDKYIVLSKTAALDEPDLIIWPETSFPGFWMSDKALTRKVLGLAKETDARILFGANTAHGLRSFNSAVLISGKTRVADKAVKYDKVHLVPFGEYVPFSDRFPFLHGLILGQLGHFTPGEELKIFNTRAGGSHSEVAFASLICYEDIFPEIAGFFTENGAEFLVVITNDAWYGKSGAPYQHAACSVFRAIENRIPVVRCANTGYSCFIDSRGRIYDPIEKNGSHLFVSGFKTSEIRLYNK